MPQVPALVCSAIIAYWVSKPISWVGFGGNLLGLRGSLCGHFAKNVPLWSLDYEIWFYILSGCAAAMVVSAPRGRVASGFVIAMAVPVLARLGAEFLSAWLVCALTY